MADVLPLGAKLNQRDNLWEILHQREEKKSVQPAQQDYRPVQALPPVQPPVRSRSTPGLPPLAEPPLGNPPHAVVRYAGGNFLPSPKFAAQERNGSSYHDDHAWSDNMRWDAIEHGHGMFKDWVRRELDQLGGHLQQVRAAAFDVQAKLQRQTETLAGQTQRQELQIQDLRSSVADVGSRAELLARLVQANAGRESGGTGETGASAWHLVIEGFRDDLRREADMRASLSQETAAKIKELHGLLHEVTSDMRTRSPSASDPIIDALRADLHLVREESRRSCNELARRCDETATACAQRMSSIQDAALAAVKELWDEHHGVVKDCKASLASLEEILEAKDKFAEQAAVYQRENHLNDLKGAVEILQSSIASERNERAAFLSQAETRFDAIGRAIESSQKHCLKDLDSLRQEVKLVSNKQARLAHQASSSPPRVAAVSDSIVGNKSVVAAPVEKDIISRCLEAFDAKYAPQRAQLFALERRVSEVAAGTLEDLTNSENRLQRRIDDALQFQKARESTRDFEYKHALRTGLDEQAAASRHQLSKMQDDLSHERQALWTAIENCNLESQRLMTHHIVELDKRLEVEGKAIEERVDRISEQLDRQDAPGSKQLAIDAMELTALTQKTLCEQTSRIAALETALVVAEESLQTRYNDLSNDILLLEARLNAGVEKACKEAQAKAGAIPDLVLKQAREEMDQIRAAMSGFREALHVRIDGLESDLRRHASDNADGIARLDSAQEKFEMDVRMQLMSMRDQQLALPSILKDGQASLVDNIKSIETSVDEVRGQVESWSLKASELDDLSSKQSNTANHLAALTQQVASNIASVEARFEDACAQSSEHSASHLAFIQNTVADLCCKLDGLESCVVKVSELAETQEASTEKALEELRSLLKVANSGVIAASEQFVAHEGFVLEALAELRLAIACEKSKVDEPHTSTLQNSVSESTLADSYQKALDDLHASKQFCTEVTPEAASCDVHPNLEELHAIKMLVDETRSQLQVLEASQRDLEAEAASKKELDELQAKVMLLESAHDAASCALKTQLEEEHGVQISLDQALSQLRALEASHNDLEALAASKKALNDLSFKIMLVEAAQDATSDELQSRFEEMHGFKTAVDEARFQLQSLEASQGDLGKQLHAERERAIEAEAGMQELQEQVRAILDDIARTSQSEFEGKVHALGVTHAAACEDLQTKFEGLQALKTACDETRSRLDALEAVQQDLSTQALTERERAMEAERGLLEQIDAFNLTDLRQSLDSVKLDQAKQVEDQILHEEVFDDLAKRLALVEDSRAEWLHKWAILDERLVAVENDSTDANDEAIQALGDELHADLATIEEECKRQQEQLNAQQTGQASLETDVETLKDQGCKLDLSQQSLSKGLRSIEEDVIGLTTSVQLHGKQLVGCLSKDEADKLRARIDGGLDALLLRLETQHWGHDLVHHTSDAICNAFLGILDKNIEKLQDRVTVLERLQA